MGSKASSGSSSAAGVQRDLIEAVGFVDLRHSFEHGPVHLIHQIPAQPSCGVTIRKTFPHHWGGHFPAIQIYGRYSEYPRTNSTG